MIDALRAIVGEHHVLVDGDLRAGYEVDWTGRFRGSTPVVVRPGSVDEVAAVVLACGEAGATIVPQGGNTGLVGGGVPLAGEVVLSLRRLSVIEPVDVLAGQVTAGAGATLGSLQEAARGVGLAFGVDLSARDSATIGGMVATNAGGLRHIRYGSMRANVVGVEAVLADGSIVRRLAGLTKDNTGYDLTSLLCGSEGTLGIVTAARLRLVPPARDLVTAVVAMPSVAAAVEAVATMRSHVVLEAAEVWLRMPAPVRDAGAYLLLEWAGAVGALGVIDPRTPRSPTTRRVAASCGATGNRSPRRSAPSGCRTRWTSPFPRPRWRASATRSSALPRPTRRSSSVTSATATST